MFFVEASRELGVGVTPAFCNAAALLPQHPLSARWNPPWSATDVPPHIERAFSGEKNVAPPVAPTRSSLTRFGLSVDRTASDVVYRVDCWLP